MFGAVRLSSEPPLVLEATAYKSRLTRGVGSFLAVQLLLLSLPLSVLFYLISFLVLRRSRFHQPRAIIGLMLVVVIFIPRRPRIPAAHRANPSFSLSSRIAFARCR